MRVTTAAVREKTEAIASGGMVQARHPLAAEAGLAVLERGGNAVDAAVTAALAAGVTIPSASGIGGGGYLVYHRAATGTTHVVDFAMQAPGAAWPEMYAGDLRGGTDSSVGWRRVLNDANLTGWTSVAVPGAVAGLSLALERFGTVSFAAALGPAIRLAGEGWLVGESFALQWLGQRRRILAEPTAREVLTKDGEPYAAGDRFRQPALARTLLRLAEHGPDDYYRGQVARDLATDLGEHGSFVGAADLAAYAPRVPDAPLEGHYHGVTVHAAPCAAGAPNLIMSLHLMDGFDAGAQPADSPQALHLWIESFRLAWADHFRHLADPRLVDVPWRGLLSPEYAAERRRLIDPRRAADRVTAGDPWRYEGRPAPATGYAPSHPWETGGTTHVCAVDRERNVVALTSTNVSWAGVISPRTGIFLNNAMSWFDPEPGHANSIAAHKRGLNNMAPAIVLRDGRPLAALGATGGRQIINTLAQVVSCLVDRRMGIAAALAAPRVDCARPEARLDARLPAATVDALRQMGHRLGPLGRPGASPAGIVVDWETGLLHGGDAPYNDGVAMGYSL